MATVQRIYETVEFKQARKKLREEATFSKNHTFQPNLNTKYNSRPKTQLMYESRKKSAETARARSAQKPIKENTLSRPKVILGFGRKVNPSPIAPSTPLKSSFLTVKSTVFASTNANTTNARGPP